MTSAGFSAELFEDMNDPVRLTLYCVAKEAEAGRCCVGAILAVCGTISSEPELRFRLVTCDCVFLPRSVEISSRGDRRTDSTS